MKFSEDVIPTEFGNSDSFAIVIDEIINQPVLCISGAALSGQKMALIGGTAYFANTLEDIVESIDVFYDDIVIYPETMDFPIDEQLESVLKKASRVHWHLEGKLQDVLVTLVRATWSHKKNIKQINFRSTGIVITTSSTSGVPLNDPWFSQGIRAGSMEERYLQGGSLKLDHSFETDELRAKLLMALQTINLIVNSNLAGTTSNTNTDSSSDLENQLILLKNRYDALDRKYESLASSKFGKLTLKLWKLKKKRV